jgi:dihydrofolate reductase
MIFKKIIGIGACDLEGVMGKNGQLPWHCPEDLQHFAETTLGSPMIMGYRTFLSLPEKYFKERTNIVFTRQKRSSHHVNFVSSLSEFFSLKRESEDLYVIGGAQIYTLFFEENLLQEFILTKLKNTYEGDTVFPLSFLHDWPSIEMKKNDTLSIHRHFNPLRGIDAD